MRRFFIAVFIACLYTPGGVFAQGTVKATSFDSAYYYIATTLAATNINEAVVKAEALLEVPGDSLQKIRSQMLLATLYERTGKHTEALSLAIKAEKLAEKINNRDWQVRISGFLSTTFRDLGLIAEGKKYIAIAEEINAGNSTPTITLFIHQEKTYYEMETGDFVKALAEIKQAIALSENAPANSINPVIQATSYQLAGDCYLHQDSLQQASIYLEKALNALGNQETELKGFIYQNMGELALKKNDLYNANKYLELALGYTASSDNINLKLHTYRILGDYYSIKKDNKKTMEFQAKYAGLLETHSSLTKSVSNDLIKKLGNEIEQKTSNNLVLFSLCAVLLLAIISVIAYLTWLRKKERARYLEFIARLKRQDLAMQAGDAEKETGSNLENDKKQSLYIPEETENRVLNDLAELERKQFYLDNNINLSYLSATLKTNSKYLSVIINKHKGKDISNYINELRINYIIRKLQEEPSYQGYKIAYLSQECGFSSHSKFTIAFKNVTGISPSSFINNLRKDTLVRK